MRNKLLIILSILAIGGCKKVEEATLLGPDYYPMSLDKHVIYSTTEIIHDGFLNISDTSNYLIKETFVKVLEDTNDKEQYLILIEKSEDSGSTWDFIKNGTVSKDNYSVQRYEDDVRKVKISFPLKNRKSWDANEYNVEEYQRARMINLDEWYGNDNHSFEETITIDLGTEIDEIFTLTEVEIYAKGIGLIERRHQNLETQPGKYIKGTEHVSVFKESNW